LAFRRGLFFSFLVLSTARRGGGGDSGGSGKCREKRVKRKRTEMMRDEAGSDTVTGKEKISSWISGLMRACMMDKTRPFFFFYNTGVAKI